MKKIIITQKNMEKETLSRKVLVSELLEVLDQNQKEVKKILDYLLKNIVV